jgi:hypothetical protein
MTTPKASQTSRPSRLLVTKQIEVIDHVETGKVMRAYRRINGVPVSAFWSIGIGPALLAAMENGSYPDWDLKTVEAMKTIIDNYNEREFDACIESED